MLGMVGGAGPGRESAVALLELGDRRLELGRERVVDRLLDANLLHQRRLPRAEEVGQLKIDDN